MVEGKAVGGGDYLDDVEAYLFGNAVTLHVGVGGIDQAAHFGVVYRLVGVGEQGVAPAFYLYYHQVLWGFGYDIYFDASVAPVLLANTIPVVFKVVKGCFFARLP